MFYGATVGASAAWTTLATYIASSSTLWYFDNYDFFNIKEYLREREREKKEL